MRNLYTIMFVILSFISKAQSPGGLAGIITDKATQKPIENVNIFIPEHQKSAITDSLGRFELPGVGKGTVQLQVTCIGYRSIVLTVDLNSSTDVTIALERSSMELEEVVVTSNSTRLPDDVPYSVQTVSSDELKETGTITPMQALSFLPGIDRISIGNGIGKPVIRGLSFNRIMLYGQGTRIENQQWDDHHDLGLSDAGIETIEIVRGPAALIYGADALGGALIFVDEKPARSGIVKGDANLGFFSNTLGINGDAGFKKSSANGIFYGLRLGGNSQTSYIQGEGNEINKPVNGEKEDFAPNSKFMNLIGKGNVGISKEWGVSKFSYSYFNQLTGIIEDESADTSAGVNNDSEQRDREMEAPYQDVTTHVVSLENTFLTGKSKLNINAAYQFNDRKEFEPLPDKQKEKAIGLKLNVVTYDLKWTSDAEKKIGFIVGTQGMFLKNKNNGMESLVPNADVNNLSGFGLIRYDSDKFNLLGGLRVDARHIEAESYERAGVVETDSFILISRNHLPDTISKPEVELDKNYTPVSFSAGGAYHPNKSITIKLNVATGFSAPNYAELGTFGKHEGTYRFERGNTTLKFEQNVEGDLGFIWEHESISLNLGGYINKVKNYIYIQNTGDTIIRITPNGNDSLPVYDYLQGDAEIKGGEISFDIHPKSQQWMDFSASYAYTKGKLEAGGNLPYIPSGKLIAKLKINFRKMAGFIDPYLALTVSNYSKQKNVAEYELSSTGYTLLDMHIGSSFLWKTQRVRFDVFCTNAFNKGYFNQLSLVKYIGVRDMGRNIGVQLHIPFGMQ